MKELRLIILLLLLMPLASFGQFKIRGVVKDAATKQALPGVQVAMKPDKTGTYTDMNGAFEIPSKTPTAELTFTFIGYNSLQVILSASDTAVVYLAEDPSLLLEQKDAYIKNSLDLGYYADARQAPYGIIGNYSLQRVGKVSIGFNTSIKYWKEGANSAYDLSAGKELNLKKPYLPGQLLFSYKSMNYRESAFRYEQLRGLTTFELPLFFALDLGGAYNELATGGAENREQHYYFSGAIGITKIFTFFSPLKNWGAYGNLNYHPRHPFYEAAIFKTFYSEKFPAISLIGKYYDYGDQAGLMLSLRLKLFNTRSFCCHSWRPYYDVLNPLK